MQEFTYLIIMFYEYSGTDIHIYGTWYLSSHPRPTIKRTCNFPCYGMLERRDNYSVCVRAAVQGSSSMAALAVRLITSTNVVGKLRMSVAQP